MSFLLFKNTIFEFREKKIEKYTDLSVILLRILRMKIYISQAQYRERLY